MEFLLRKCLMIEVVISVFIGRVMFIRSYFEIRRQINCNYFILPQLTKVG